MHRVNHPSQILSLFLAATLLSSCGGAIAQRQGQASSPPEPNLQGSEAETTAPSSSSPASQEIAEAEATRMAQATTATHTVEHLNIPYAAREGVDPNRLSLDIYAPEAATAAPVVVYVHGGLWQAGDKGQVGHQPRFYNQAGFVFVSLNYRLSPAAQHPDHIEDLAQAIAWISDRIQEYGGNPEEIILTGHSAGAHLVTLLGTDGRYLQGVGQDLSVLKGIIALDSGAMDIRRPASRGAGQDNPYRVAFGNDPAVWEAASPMVHADTGGLPPLLLVLADGLGIDAKREELQRFAAVLRQYNNRTDVVDAVSFRSHRSLLTELGTTDDPVSAEILGFIQSILSPNTPETIGRDRTLRLEGSSAVAAEQEIAAYRLEILRQRFDQNQDGVIQQAEVPAAQQPFFQKLDRNSDGVLTEADF